MSDLPAVAAAKIAGERQGRDNGTGARRQIVVYEANHDLSEVTREIVEATVPDVPGRSED